MIRFLSILAIGFELADGTAWAAKAPETAPFEGLLARTEHRMEQFWDQFSAVTCTETVEQQKLADNGKMLIKRRSAYDYLVLLLLSGGDLTVQESRILKGKPAKESDRALLSTSGFSTLVLIFHPHFRESFAFTDEGADPSTPALHRVHFAHIHGKRVALGAAAAVARLSDRMAGHGLDRQRHGQHRAHPGGFGGFARRHRLAEAGERGELRRQ